ncbi:MAG TPA: hypothetical protein VGG27_07610 [Magnetospirillaceae bacterium]|jgi:hypothetical protein
MVADVHLNAHLFLITGLTLLLAWGPAVAAIASGVVWGLRFARNKQSPRKPDTTPRA